MARRFTVRPLAEADLENAARWYEDERAGLAERFFSDVDRTFAYPRAATSLPHRVGRGSPIVPSKSKRAKSIYLTDWISGDCP
jgi:plasmid stabilization system protein ParE